MAFKVLILARKRANLAWEEFVESYEDHCDWMQDRIDAGTLAPLIDYRRNFIEPNHRLKTRSASALDFDVVAEAWFEDESGLDRNNRAAADPAFLETVLEELRQYVELDSIRYVPVREFGSRLTPPGLPTKFWRSKIDVPAVLAKSAGSRSTSCNAYPDGHGG